MSDSLQPHGLQHTRPLCPPLSPRIYSDSCPLNQWCYLTMSSSVALFSFCLQSFPASGSFPMSQFFASGGQGIGASASASVLSMNIQGWFPLGLTGLISFQSKRLSGVLFSTTIWQIHYPKYSKSRWVVSDSATPWTAAHQASLSFTISRSLLKCMSIESVMPSNHLILCCPLLFLPSIFPSIRVFNSESTFHMGGQSIGASALASVLTTNTQPWFPLGLTGLISLQSKGLKSLLQHHSSKPPILCCSAFMVQLTSIHGY